MSDEKSERPRRRRGTGSVEPQSDGAFRARLPGRGGRLPPVATYREAEVMLDEALARIASGKVVRVDGKTLAGFGIGVLDARERRGIRGIVTERSRWKTHVESHAIGSLAVAAVTRVDVTAWRDDLLEKHATPGKWHKLTKARVLSRTTVQNTVNLLRAVLAEAVERGMIEANAADGVKLPRSAGSTHDPWTYLLPEEQEALLRCERIPEERRLLIAFALGTGMRQGEVWNLELGDIRADHVIVRYGSRGKATKSGKVRRVPLFGIARVAIDCWLPMLAKQSNPHGLAWPLPGGTCRQKGEPMWWADALRLAGIVASKRHDRRPVRWHDLRHSCGSSLIAGWWGRRWTLEEVRDLLGHSSVTITERYAHLAETVLAEAAKGTAGMMLGRSIGEKLSHLRDLNSRPTVYEGEAQAFKCREVTLDLGTTLGLLGHVERALGEMATGRATALHSAHAALDAIASTLLAALATTGQGSDLATEATA